MAEGRLRQAHNRLDNAEDTAKFYDFDTRRVAATGPKGKKLKVLAPVFCGPREKIIEGPIPVGFDGYVRLPKYTQRAIYRPSGSVSIREVHYGQPCSAHVHNDGNSDAYLGITCIGSWKQPMGLY